MHRAFIKQVGLGAAALMCCLSGSAFAQQSNGADVIVGELPGFSNNATELDPNLVSYDAFAVGTTSCNKGNVPLLWFTGGNDNRHPVIGQNLFRLSNGRFEQIGQAWLKHGFTALQGTECAGDPGFGVASCTATPGTTLGVGCSDPYSASLNNGQSGLGPKWQVNAATGTFPYPFASPAFSGTTDRRLRVRSDDLNVPGSSFYVEGQYVCIDDSAAGNKNNSASYRPVSVTGTTEFAMAGNGGTVRELPAIFAWQAADPTVTITTADVANDGRFILGAKVTNNGNGTWTYEYALQNLNSHRCAGSFIVPLPGTQSALTNLGFHDVEYHSGEPNQLASTLAPAADDWSVSGGGASATTVSWAGPTYAGTPPVYTTSGFFVTGFTAGTGNDHTANVLRWGTLFNYRFTTNIGPATGSVAIGLWRPPTGGDPISVSMTTQTPGGATAGVLTGVCCTGGTCTVVTQTACTGGGGTFGLLGGSCSPNPCGTGTCCFNGGCTSTTQAACTGTWTSGGSCSPNPCPAPSGACCIGAACTITTQAACAGNFVGASTTCSTPCPPTNDLCANAIPLCGSLGTATGISVAGSNRATGTEGTASCVTSSLDVWYLYTPAVTQTLTIATCNAPASNPFDTVLTAYTGACTGLTEVACNDDITGCGTRSRISFPGTAGVQYKIRVAGWNGANGNFVITVTGGNGQGCNLTGRCCVGTSCTQTIQSACSGTWAGGTCSPNPCDPSGSCCIGTTCSSTTQSACGGAFASGGTCSPNPCNPVGACCSAGTCVSTTINSCNGTFTAGASCTPNPCAPLSDDCNNRAGVGLGTTPFDTTNATTDGPAHTPACDFFGNAQIGKDVWFNHPCSFDGTLEIDTCGSLYDTKIAVYGGTGCLNLDTRLLACNDDNAAATPAGCGAGSLQSKVILTVVAGQHYTIRIGGYTSGSGAVTSGTGVLNLTATPAPTGSCCFTDGNCLANYLSQCTGTWTSGGSCSPNICAQPSGACCDIATGSCTVLSHGACGGAGSTYQGDNSICTPNPCPQPTGACCCGSSCTLTLAAACTGTNQAFSGAGTACAPYSNTVPCCRGDYNKSAGNISVQDIFDFLAGYFAGDACADTNDSGPGNSVQDIFDFLAAYFGGC